MTRSDPDDARADPDEASPELDDPEPVPDDSGPDAGATAVPTAPRREYLARLGGATALATVAGSGGTTATGVAGAQADAPEDLAGREWELAWSDEFEAGIDEDVWSFAVGNGHEQGIPGWGNEELQYYTDGDNARVEDGRLVIEAREEAASDEYGSYDYTSSRMLTAGKRQFRYGRLDVRATLPEGQGIWPAIWLLGSDIDEVGWPDCGEIDVMELVGDEPATVHGTVHGPGYSAGESIGGGYTLPEGTFSDGPHTFSIVWDPDRIRWFVDGERYFQVTRSDVEARGAEWVFDDGPFYLLLNVAVGGQWPGYPDETTEFPQQMVVDHVRAYEAVEGTTCGGSPVHDATEVEGRRVCSVREDDRFRDFNADGSVTQADVTEFFSVQHRDGFQNRPDLFDYNGNGSVGLDDVVYLFQRL